MKMVGCVYAIFTLVGLLDKSDTIVSAAIDRASINPDPGYATTSMICEQLPELTCLPNVAVVATGWCLLGVQRRNT